MRRRGDELSEHILFTAKDVFLEFGFERASKDLARVVQSSPDAGFGRIDDLGNPFAGHAFHFEKHEHRSVAFRHLGQRGLDSTSHDCVRQ